MMCKKEKHIKNSIIISLDNNFYLTKNFFVNLLITTNFEQLGYEIIVVYDGNRIDTLEYLTSLEQKYSFIRLFKISNKIGYSVANNYAVNKAAGEIITFMNSNVFPTNSSIQTLVSYIENNMADIVQGLLLFPQNGRVQSTGYLFINSMAPHVYLGKPADHPLVQKEATRQALTTDFLCMKKNLFEKYGKFDERYYNASEDQEFTLKVYLNGGKCLYTPQAIAYHCTGDTRKFISRNENQQKGVLQDLKDYLAPQITEEISHQKYYVINCSYMLDWRNILNELNISTTEKFDINDRFGSKINLYYNLPYSAIDYEGPYLFLTNTIEEIRGNKKWFDLRKNTLDIVLDFHGNLERVYDL